MSKPFYILLTLLLLTALNSYSQRPKTSISNPDTTFNLDFIKDFRIKIDGGCNFYTFDTTSLDRRKYIFIVSAKKVGFINLKNKPDYIYLKRVSRRNLSNDSHQDIFTGQGYKITLTTKEVGKLNDNSSFSKGTLELQNNKRTQTFKIRGEENE